MRLKHFAVMLGLVVLNSAVARGTAAVGAANPAMRLSFAASIGLPLLLMVVTHLLAALLVAGWNGVQGLTRFLAAAVAAVASIGAANFFIQLVDPLLEQLRDALSPSGWLGGLLLVVFWSVATVCLAHWISRGVIFRRTRLTSASSRTLGAIE
ncbi:MAG: hypothetical protein JXE06_07045 [Coriobacteriia bacterium]|nr:hypothetical protein [Coriobacteriia bacterium]MBN2822263.1 hypothetical protein [Coriobacteriia bacterium]